MNKKNLSVIAVGIIVLVAIGFLIFPGSDKEAIIQGDVISETPQVTEQPESEPELPETLELLEFDCAHFRYSEMLGYQAKYSGEIKNTGDSLEQFVKVHITFLTNGEIIGTTFTLIDSVSLLPGETSGFEGDMKNLPSEIDSCEIRVTSN